jgi:hypothetical protein
MSSLDPTTSRQLAKLLSSVGRVADDIEELIDAISKYTAAQKDTNEPSPPIIQAELKLPPTITADYAVSQRKEDARGKFKLCLEIATVIFLFIAAVLTYKQWREMNHQTGSLRDQLTAMRQQNEVDQRPWLKMEAAPGSPVAFDSSGASFEIVFRLTNVGKTPAIGAVIDKELFLLGPARGEVFDTNIHRQTICDQAIRHSPNVGEIVFPDDSIPLTHRFNVTVDELAKYQIGGMVAMTVIACAGYHTAFSKEVYYTGSVYDVNRIDRTRPNLGPTAIVIGKDVPMGDFVFWPQYWNGTTAK